MLDWLGKTFNIANQMRSNILTKVFVNSPERQFIHRAFCFERTQAVAGRIALLASVVLIDTGCSTSQWKTPPSPGDGFVAFDSPRDFDAPGQVYRIDTQGNLWQVGTIGVVAKSGKERTRTMESKANWSLSTVLKTIGASATQLPANARAEVSRSREVTIEGTDVTREWIEDTQQPAQKVAKLLSDTEYRSGNKYFLIRETQAVQALTFHGSRKWLANAGVEAEIQKEISGKAEFKIDNNDSYSIVAKFDHPMRVWYKAEKVEPKFGAARGGRGGLEVELQEARPNELRLPARKIVTKP